LHRLNLGIEEVSSIDGGYEKTLEEVLKKKGSKGPWEGIETAE